ncbi:MAG: hypothetical protein ABL921_25965 [Pirellula sp.]
MSVTKFFEKLTGHQSQRQKQKILGYRAMVAEIANGGEPSPQEVERLLSESGKSIEDLQRDVERHERRVSLKELVASLPKLGIEQSKLQHQIADANRDLEDAERRHNEIMYPLESRLREINSAQSEASRAKQELFETCDDPELRRKWDETMDQLNQNNARQRELVSEISTLDNKAVHASYNAERETSKSEHERVKEKAAAFKKRADELRSGVKGLARTNTDLEIRRNQIEKQMQDW